MPQCQLPSLSVHQLSKRILHQMAEGSAQEVEEHGAGHVEERDESLLLAPSYPSGNGSRPSVSIDCERNVAVAVYDDRFFGLYCQVGDVNKRSNTVNWSEPVKYGTGKQPSVALIRLGDLSYVLEVHREVIFKKSIVNVGSVQTEGVKRVVWKAEYPHEVLQCSVVKPKVSATNNGTYVIFHEEAYTRKGMRYHFGRFERREEVGQEKLFLSELQLCRPFLAGYGVEPDLAISGNRVVVVFRSGYRDLDYYTGVINDLRNPIQWHQFQFHAGTGINPSISINGRGYVVVAYQTKTRRQLHYVYGHIENNSIVRRNDGMSSSFGECPTITLADDGYIVAVYKSWVGYDLLCCAGKLENQVANQAEAP
jgi:hypothetical protein